MQWRSVWYHFSRRTLYSAVQCALACDTPSDRDQRGGSNQISFGERHPCRDGCGFAKYYSLECRRSYRQHGLIHSDRDRSTEYDGGLEFEWRGL